MGIVFLLFFWGFISWDFFFILASFANCWDTINFFSINGDWAGLTNIIVISFNLSLLRISSGCQPKWKTDGPKALLFSTMTDVCKNLEIFWPAFKAMSPALLIWHKEPTAIGAGMTHSSCGPACWCDPGGSAYPQVTFRECSSFICCQICTIEHVSLSWEKIFWAGWLAALWGRWCWFLPSHMHCCQPKAVLCMGKTNATF